MIEFTLNNNPIFEFSNKHNQHNFRFMRIIPLSKYIEHKF